MIKFAAIGAIVNSALYLAGLLVVGVWVGDVVLVKAALLSVGVTFLCYLSQLSGAHPIIPLTLNAIAIAVAASGGFWLILGH
jgi:hypothetical protein